MLIVINVVYPNACDVYHYSFTTNRFSFVEEMPSHCDYWLAERDRLKIEVNFEEYHHHYEIDYKVFMDHKRYFLKQFLITSLSEYIKESSMEVKYHDY